MNIYEEKLMPLIEKTCAAIEATPQMQDILRGTLPLERFRYQIRQNYQYLLDYTRCWAVGMSKARGFDEMEKWYAIVKDTMEGTVLCNRDFWARRIGLTMADLDGEIMAPGKRSYTSHELARAMEGDLATCMMGLFPCNVLYWHMGEHLMKLCRLPEGNMYRDWIEFYTKPAYAAKCGREIDMINRLCADRRDGELRALVNVFATGCNYELLQWRDMYYNMETWPLPELFEK